MWGVVPRRLRKQRCAAGDQNEQSKSCDSIRWRTRLTQLLGNIHDSTTALCILIDLNDANRESILNHDHFSVSEWHSLGDQFHGLADLAIKFDNGSFA